MNTHLDNTLSDDELDARLRTTLATIMPLLDTPSTTTNARGGERSQQGDGQPLANPAGASPLPARRRSTEIVDEAIDSDQHSRSLSLVARDDLHRRSWAKPLLGAAAAAVIVVGLGVIASTRNGQTPPPAASEPIEASAPPVQVPRTVNPSDYPVFGELGALSDTLGTGAWETDPALQRPLRVVLGRPVEAGYDDIVHVSVYSGSYSEWPADAVSTPMIVADTDVTRFVVERPSPIPISVGFVWESNGATISITDSPVIDQLVTALTAFVDADGLPGIETARLMAHVPEGYELLDGPAVDLAETGPNLETHSETNDNVGLTVWPTLMLSGPTWQTVQIGSERGYLIEPHTGVGGYEQASLAWPTPNGSWATLYGYGAIARQLPQIASQVTWVDRNTWVNTYDASPTEPFPGATSADAPTSSSNDGTTEPTSTAP